MVSFSKVLEQRADPENPRCQACGSRAPTTTCNAGPNHSRA